MMNLIAISGFAAWAIVAQRRGKRHDALFAMLWVIALCVLERR